MISFEWCVEHQACYPRYILRAMFPKPRSLQEVLSIQEAPWTYVPFHDRLWAATKFLSKEQLCLVVFRFLKARLGDSMLLAPIQDWLLNDTLITQDLFEKVHTAWADRLDEKYQLTLDIMRGPPLGWLNRLYRQDYNESEVITLIGEVL